MWLVFFLLVVVDGQCDFPVYTELPDDWKNKAFVLKSPNLNEEFRMEVKVDNLYTTYGNRSVGIDHMIGNHRTEHWKKTTMKNYFDEYILPYHDMEVDEILRIDPFQMYLLGKSDVMIEGDRYSMLPAEVLDKHRCLMNSKDKGFGIAAKGTGVEFHSHRQVLTETVYGKKLWMVYKEVPQNEEITQKMTPRELYNISTEYDMKKCVTETGDIISIPTGWYHATFNLETSFCVVCSYPDETDPLWYYRGSGIGFPFWYKLIQYIRFQLIHHKSVLIKTSNFKASEHSKFFDTLLFLKLGHFTSQRRLGYEPLLVISTCRNGIYLSFDRHHCEYITYLYSPKMSREEDYLLFKMAKEELAKSADDIVKMDRHFKKDETGFF